MGARLLLISITELAAYVIMGTIYLFMCWDFLLIKERLDSSLEITLTYSSNTLAALNRREAVSKRCVVASNLASVFVWMEQLEVDLVELRDDTMDCRCSNALPTPPRVRPWKQAAVTFSSTEWMVCVDCIFMWQWISSSNYDDEWILIVAWYSMYWSLSSTVRMDGAAFEFFSHQKETIQIRAPTEPPCIGFMVIPSSNWRRCNDEDRKVNKFAAMWGCDHFMKSNANRANRFAGSVVEG